MVGGFIIANYLQWLERYPERKRLFWCVGSDYFQLEDVLQAELESRVIDGMDYVQLDGEEDGAAIILDALQQVPSGLNRIVIIRNGNKVDWSERLLSFIKDNYSNFQLLVLSVEDKVDSMEQRFRLFVKKGRFVNCGKMKDTVKFIVFCCDIDLSAAKLLVEVVGSGYSNLKWALLKLKSFGCRITSNMVSAYIPKIQVEEFVDELLEGKKPFPEGIDIPKVLGLLEYKLKQFMIFLSIKWQRLSNQQLAQIVEMPVFYVERFKNQSRNVDAKKVKRWIFLLCQIDAMRRRGIKEGLIEYLVAVW